MDSKNNVLMKPLSNAQQRFQAPPPPGGGDSGFQVTGMIEWSQKSRPKKIPRASSKTQKNSWTKN